jgi:hypothetical protein
MIKKIKFTELQTNYLIACRENNDCIKSKAIINKLERAGIVIPHAHTGKKVTTPFGSIVTAWYVDNVNQIRIDGIGLICHKYSSGSFYPYVVVIP